MSFNDFFMAPVGQSCANPAYLGEVYAPPAVAAVGVYRRRRPEALGREMLLLVKRYLELKIGE